MFLNDLWLIGKIALSALFLSGANDIKVVLLGAGMRSPLALIELDVIDYPAS